MAQPRAGGTPLVQETFTGAVADPGFVAVGAACLTGAPAADPARPFLSGVERGYLGVGLDVLGNYFADWEQRGNGCDRRSPAGTPFRVPGPGANTVTVRGSGDGVQGYCFLAATTSNLSTGGPWPSTLPGKLQGPLTSLPPGATAEQAQAALEPSRRRVNVHLTPAPEPVLTVSIDFNDGSGSRQVLSTPAPQPVPTTYKFGFAASTGLFTDVHLIRNMVIATEQPLPTLNLVKQPHEPLPGLLLAGTPVPYEFVVTNAGTSTVTGLAVACHQPRPGERRGDRRSPGRQCAGRGPCHRYRLSARRGSGPWRLGPGLLRHIRSAPGAEDTGLLTVGRRGLGWAAAVRRAARWILPLAVLGSSGTKCTARG